MDKMNRKILNKRILSNMINFFVYFLIYFIISKIITEDYSMPFLLSLPIGILIYIIYFGFIPKVTNGYTLGGFITQMRLFSLNKTPINISDSYKRAFDVFLFYNKWGYMHKVLVNSVYQWEPDIKYNITLLPKDFEIKDLSTRGDWKQIDDFFIFFPALIKNALIVGFGISIVTNIISYIINLFN